MDKISLLPDELLILILSLVPIKIVFDAQVVSKRWQSLWRRLPSLIYDSDFHISGNQFSVFVHRTLELIESPVLESFYLRVSPTVLSSFVLKSDQLVKRPLHELKVVSTNPDLTLLLKKTVYQYQTLVILRLESLSLEDNDHGNPISLRSLKVLQLSRVKYPSDESLSNLLSSLPSLTDLILDQCLSKLTKTLAIAVPCLKSLTVVRCPDSCQSKLMMLNVNAPSLNYLNIEDYWRKVSFADQKMEKLIDADINVTFINTEKLLTTLTSAKRLSLCLVTSKIPQSNNVLIFDQLVRLEICTCQHEWWSLLERVFLYSPKLRFLKLHQKHCFGIIDPTVRWKEPSYVPECFACHLETFEWKDYEGTEDEKILTSYIMRNAGRLKIVTIYPLISHPDKRMHRFLKYSMHKELKNLCPCGFTCRLVFK